MLRSFQLTPQKNYRKVLRYELTANTPQDLYEKNYSTVKANDYGTDLLGNGVFTGDTLSGSEGSPATKYYTDTGEVVVASGRYRCLTSSLTLVSIDTVGATLSTAPVEGSDEWLAVESGDSLSRWVKSNINATITVETGGSLISSDTNEATILSDVFPSWTKIYTDATSNGFRLLNVPALEMEKIKMQSVAWPQRGYINSIPVGIKSHAYICELPSYDNPIDVSGTYDSIEYVLSCAEDLTEFIEAESTEHVYYQDERKLFVSCGYDDSLLTVDGVTYPLEQVHIVNPFDYIGASLDLERLPEETNTAYKTRLLDVYANPPGASLGRIEAAIERECGIPIENIWELNNSEVPWAVPNDPATTHVFYTEATDEHRELAQWCNDQAQIGFDYFRWGRMRWDLYPHPWDLAEIPYLLDKPLSDESLARAPGVGYGSDLEPAPYEDQGTYPYSVMLNARGYTKDEVYGYIPVTASGRIVPSATRTVNLNEFSGWVALELSTSLETYMMNIPVVIARDPYVVSNTHKFIYVLPKPGTYTSFHVAVENDTTGATVELVQSDVITYRVYDGKWDFSGQHIDDNSPADTLSLGFDSGMTIFTWEVSTFGGHPELIHVMCDELVGSTEVTSWEGDGASFTLTCNTNMEAGIATIPMPSNHVTIDGLGGIMYALVVDAIEPVEATSTTGLALLGAGSYGTYFEDWPPPDAYVQLSSTYQDYRDRYTPYSSAAIVIADSVTVDLPIKVHAVGLDSFSLPATFEGGIYELQVNGQVYVRLVQDIGVGTSDIMTVELNPCYNMYKWPPRVRPGTVYLSDNEYYLHANEVEEALSGTTHVCDYQVASGSIFTFTGSSPTELHYTDSGGIPSLLVTQTVVGNGTRYFPIWYDNANTIQVDSVSKSLHSGTDNIVDNSTATIEGQEYTVTYYVTNSFCVDYNHIEDGEFRPELTFSASQTGNFVQYTPYDAEGYWIDTDIPTNPLFTVKNRDFMYIDDEEQTATAIAIVTRPLAIYRGMDNPIFARLTDADGNGVPGVTVNFTMAPSTNNPGGDTITDGDGYCSWLVYGDALPTTEMFVQAWASAPNVVSYYYFKIIDNWSAKPGGLSLIHQEFQVAAQSQAVEQVIKILALDSSGAPRDTIEGIYTIWCEDAAEEVPSTPIYTGSDGIHTLIYTPTCIGQYVANFTFDGITKAVGWCLVERI
jgi:hypothetical protein